jgi:hypothetical protein
LKADGKKIKFTGISKGESKKFNDLYSKFNIKYDLVNDLEDKLLPALNFDCGACTKILIVDKGGKVRYNASYVDFYFVKNIIFRYEKEEKEGE